MRNNFQRDDNSEVRGKIEISKISADKTEVYYITTAHEISVEDMFEGNDQHSLSENKKLYKVKLISFDIEKDRIEIFPINTLPTSSRFLGSKYERLQSITLDGFGVTSVVTEEEVADILNELLPSGFVKRYEYGLGFLKEYRFIVEALEDLEIDHLIICKKNEEKILIDEASHTCKMKFSIFDKMRKDLNKITSRASKYSCESKLIVANNILSFFLENEKYPQKKLPFYEDSLRKAIGAGLADISDNLSKNEQKKVLEFVSRNKTNIANTQPEILTKLHSEIETVTLENLIKNYEDNLKKKLGEEHWQNLFSKNPFILSMAFGFPMIKMGDTAYVGGKKISGNGEKITDFLVKNSLTNNVGLIEIKTPKTQILNKTPYRSSVFYPSSELSGSVNQLLDQKCKFQQEISRLRHTSRSDIESYSIKAILIIGTIPEDLEKQKSFEIFRGNLKDVFVITFDELLTKLKDLLSFLNYKD
jgi:hypothetical protein